MSTTIEASSKAVWGHLSKIIRSGYSPAQVFHDWLDLMLYALQRRDPEYLEVVGRYRNTAEQGNREIDFMADAFAELQIQLMKNCSDILGYLYTVEVTRGENGQFFTPENVCKMMAQMTLGELSDEEVSISDPCSGSGRMLIEAQKLRPKAVFVGTDIDPRCAKMTTLNMLFRNANSYVIHANSLTLEVWAAWKTTSTYLGGEVWELPKDRLHEAKALLESALTPKQHQVHPSLDTPVIQTITEQLELF